MGNIDRNSFYGVSLDSNNMYQSKMNLFDSIEQEDYFEDIVNKKLYNRYIRELSNDSIVEMYFEETEGIPSMIEYDKNHNSNITKISEEEAKQKYPQYFI